MGKQRAKGSSMEKNRKRGSNSKTDDLSEVDVADGNSPLATDRETRSRSKTPVRKQRKIDSSSRKVLLKADENNNATVKNGVGMKQRIVPVKLKKTKTIRDCDGRDDGVAVGTTQSEDEEFDVEEEILDYEDDLDQTNDADSEVILNINEHNVRKLPHEQTKEGNAVSREEIESLQRILSNPKMRNFVKEVMTDMEPEKEKLPREKSKGIEIDRTEIREVIPVKKINTKLTREKIIKSPSDTTIYVPALCRTPENLKKGENQMIDRISEFIEGIRMNENVVNEDRRRSGPPQQRGDCIQRQPEPSIAREEPQPSTSNEQRNEEYKEDIEEARKRANYLVLEAEKYKAAMVNPAGICNNDNSDSFKGGDDDFFHLTCHVDPNLRGKIEKGEFVELEKLLPKDRRQTEGRLELINKDGMTYVVPAKEAKISSIRRWEQAFRIYAAIYSAANPQRSAEIWQYVYIINSAAAAYHWDNVSYYDTTFRQLMAFNPQRSWAKIYTQMWNLALRDPINRSTGTGTYNNWYGPQNRTSSNGAASAGNGNDRDQPKKKNRYCWKFNKNVECTDGRNCKFPHKCYYCDGNHGKYCCLKIQRKENNNSKVDAKSSPKAGNN